MNTFDLVIVVSVASAAFGAYRLGFLARVVSWLGLAVGLGVAALVVPWLVDAFGVVDPVVRLLLAAVLLVVGAFVGQAVGLVGGSKLRTFVPAGPMRMVDRGVGAVVGAVGVLVLAWLLIPVMANVPGWPAREARTSAIARAIDETLPHPPDSLRALEKVVGGADFPKVFSALQPAQDAGPPPAASGLTPAVASRVTASTVRIEGRACDRIQEGSGFVVGLDTVVTNAHVVAGEKATAVSVYRLDVRKPFTGTVTVFDGDRDLAVVHVPGLGSPALAIGDAREGTSGAVFGHPGGSPDLRIAPAKVSREVDAVGRDLYDSHSTHRDVFILAANLKPGDSGSAFADTGGRVVGVAFAIAPDRPNVAYALTSKELRAAVAEDRGVTTRTGSCLG